MNMGQRTRHPFHSLITSLAICLLTTVVAQPLSAQEQVSPRSNPTGFALGIHLNGSALEVDDAEDTESGGGIGLFLGYGFNRNVTVYLGADGASMDAALEDDAYTLGHGDLGVRVHFGGEERAALFYVDVALSAWVAQYDILGSDLDFTGTGFSLGGGLEYFFSPGFALDVGLKLTTGDFDEMSYEGETEEIDLGATSARFNLGVAWYPKG